MAINQEITHIIIAILTLTIVIGFSNFIAGNFNFVLVAVFFAFLIIISNVIGKKAIAYALDANVEHEIWFWSRYGFKPGQHFKKEIPVGVILPLITSALSVGIIKCMTLLTYETRALKKRASRRFGHYSFTEITDFHNSIIGAGGISAVLLLAVISYFIPGFEGLPSLAIFYAFWNLLPISKLDGSQIFFGSRIIYTILTIITLLALLVNFIIF